MRTKYNENVNPNKYKESRKTTSVLTEPSYQRTNFKRRKNKRKSKALSMCIIVISLTF
jgi:hypothetical protein